MTTSADNRPTDLLIVTAALGMGREWLAADEVRGRLVLYGFAVHSQQAAAWLGRMCREEMPRFEHRDRFDYREYRVTRFGKTEFANKHDGLRPWGQS